MQKIFRTIIGLLFTSWFLHQINHFVKVNSIHHFVVKMKFQIGIINIKSFFLIINLSILILVIIYIIKRFKSLIGKTLLIIFSIIIFVICNIMNIFVYPMDKLDNPLNEVMYIQERELFRSDDYYIYYRNSPLTIQTVYLFSNYDFEYDVNYEWDGEELIFKDGTEEIERVKLQDEIDELNSI